MPSERSYFLLFLTFLGLAILASSLNSGTGGSTPEFVTPPWVQSGTVRAQRLAAPTGGSVQPLSPPPVTPAPQPAVHGPVRIETTPDGHLFVIDDGDEQRIKEFSAAGELLRDFGGEATSRILSVTDLAILPERLWVADLRGGAIHTLDRQRGTWTTAKVDPAPYRLEPIADGREQLVLMRLVGPHLFDVITPVGEDVFSFGTLLEEQDHHSLALDGFLTRSASALVFSGKHLGILAAFSPDGSLLWLSHPIAAPEPPVVTESEGRRSLTRGPLPASISIAANEETVCVLTRRVAGLYVRHFLDLYAARDGSYYKTLLLPHPTLWTSVAVDSGHVYVASDRAVVAWPLSALSEKAIPLETGRSIITLSSDRNEKGDEL